MWKKSDLNQGGGNQIHTKHWPGGLPEGKAAQHDSGWLADQAGGGGAVLLAWCSHQEGAQAQSADVDDKSAQKNIDN